MPVPALHESARPLPAPLALHLPPVAAYAAEMSHGFGCDAAGAVVGVVLEGLGARGGIGEWGLREQEGEEAGGGGFEVGAGS